MFSSKVSQLWNLALVTSNVHNDRRLSWIAIRYNFLTFLVSAQVSTILIFSQETRSRERWSHSSRQTWPPLAKVGAASVGQICYFRLNDVPHVNLYRRVMQQLNNQPRQGGNSGEKRERASSSAALVSPSKVAKSFY